MRWKAYLIVRLNLDADVKVSFAERALVSLDCGYCQRMHRSVGFSLGKDHGCCSPGSALKDNDVGPHPPFPGSLVDVSHDTREEENGMAVLHEAKYTLKYESNPFQDARCPNRKWTGHPTWARIGFDLVCPKCQAKTSHSTQNNLCRPYDYTCSQCQHKLGRETEEMPILRYTKLLDDEEINKDEEDAVLKEVPSHFPPRK